MHDAVRVRVVMVQPKGVAELVDCGLRRPFDELVPSVVPEPRDRDDGKPIVDRRVPEDEVLAAIEEVHVGHGEAAVPAFPRSAVSKSDAWTWTCPDCFRRTNESGTEASGASTTAPNDVSSCCSCARMVGSTVPNGLIVRIIL